jgi:hypothetical protein
MATSTEETNMTTRNQKDQLAKLMATEDITVVHRKIPTAYFDIKNRILACPIFKEDMSNELYDLFMGHEVGHALYTPYEGVHSALVENKTLKGYLNVVEDVRIERKIRDKFAGLRKSFYKAYNELMENDFFGIKGKDLQTLSLIDKINLITKVGSRVNISLTDEEQVILDKCYACETWEEVEAVAKEIYEWSKENETRDETDESIVPQTLELGDEEEDEDGMEEESWGDGDDVEDEEEQSESSKGGSDTEDTMPDLEESEGQDTAGNLEQEDEVEEPTQKKTGSGKEGSYGIHDDEDGARESITEHFAHNNEDQFLSDTNRIITQIDLPSKFKTNKEVIDATEISFKTVLKDWNNYYVQNTDMDVEKRQGWNKIMAKTLVDKNKKLVNHMAKEFEMKQTAQRSKHAFTGKTGKLDMNRLAKYQIVEDVFKRSVYLPEGENHGLTVLLDWSGSIQNECADLIEQSIILAMFCRKVNIAHRIYLFSDSYKRGEHNGSYYDNVNLVTIASDEMNNRQWNEMMQNLASLYLNHYIDGFSWKARNKLHAWLDENFNTNYTETGYSWIATRVHPTGYSLGGTPLNQSLAVLRKLLPEFQRQYGIEKSILTVITDGYSHGGALFEKDDAENAQMKEQSGGDDYGYMTQVDREIIDPYSKKVYPYGSGSHYRNAFSITQNLLDWISKECNVTVTGYFVLGRKQDVYGILSETAPHKDYDDSWKEIKKTGMVVKCHGYNKLFLTSASLLGAAGDDELSDDLVDAKKVRVMAAFKRNQKSKTTSRFLTNEFIKEIA